MPLPVTNDERPIPDSTHYPNASNVQRIEAGSLVARIFDHVRAASGGYSARTYNPNVIDPDLPSSRGRYHGTKSFPFDALYLSQFLGSEEVVVLETIDFRIMALDPARSMRVLRRADVVDLSVAYFELSEAIELVDFTTRPACRDFYFADQRVLEGNDFTKTRAWARWVRTNAPHADGILYRSRAFGSTDAGFPLVMTATHQRGLEDRLVPYGDATELGSSEGYRLLRDLAPRTHYLPESPWAPPTP
ncbi:RES domain-containing protein [Herbiconiux daphne]|uniref:RES domain-containing protein n=1 Tax=Herbiconiux daphne TaxID=2970914 RepID=A0ABT2H579_9MICO|nr:RES domain-containing protein [Herbiconiux daphne]MCS5735090.1 RES domain-containing protein [Herbiconiux daphne]